MIALDLAFRVCYCVNIDQLYSGFVGICRFLILFCVYFFYPEPRDGHWGRWGSWGSCSVSCDQGQKIRTRTCDDPSPKNGGNDCPGESVQNAPCVMKSCNAGILSLLFIH